MEYFPGSLHPRIRNSKMGWRHGAAQCLCSCFRERDTAKSRSPDGAFREPAFEIVVRFRDISWTGTTPRHGVSGAGPIRGGIFREEVNRWLTRVAGCSTALSSLFRIPFESHRSHG